MRAPICQVGVTQSLSRSHRLELGLRRFAKRAARGRQDQASNLIAPAGAQALLKRVVLRIDGQQLSPALARRRHDQIAGSYQDLFVRQGDSFAASDRLIGGGQADHADCGGDHRIVGDVGDCSVQPFLSGENLGAPGIGAALVERGQQLVAHSIVGNRDQLGTKLQDLADELGGVATGSQGGDFGATFHLPDHLQRVAAD